MHRATALLALAPRTLSAESFAAAHLGLVYNSALRRVRNPHLAEDIAQSVFLLAMEKVDRVPLAQRTPWLLRITRNVALNTLRANRRRAHHESAANPAAPNEPFDHLLAPHLETALANLRESDRQPLILRYYQNRSLPQIASALNTSQNTASKRIHRALAKLRIQLLRKSATALLLLLALLLPLAPSSHPTAPEMRLSENPAAAPFHISLTNNTDNLTLPGELLSRQLAIASFPSADSPPLEITANRFALTLDTADNQESKTPANPASLSLY